MASRKTYFGRGSEAVEEQGNRQDTEGKSYWKTVEERFRVSQKQSAWTEDEVNEHLPSTSRGISSVENVHQSLPDATKATSGISSGEKGKRIKKIGKKKGRIHEVESRSNLQEGSGRSELVLMKSFERKEELSRRTDISVPRLSDLVEDPADFPASLTVVSTPTIQRQSLCWSPSPIHHQRRAHSSLLPPLPEMAEELIQKNLRKLKGSKAVSDNDKDDNKSKEYPKKKKKKRKKADTSLTSFESGANENRAEAFELMDLRSMSNSQSKRGHRISSDQMETLITISRAQGA